MSEVKAVSLAGVHGGDEQRSVSDLLTALLEKGPALAWCEPVPTKERPAGCWFQGLWKAPMPGLWKWLKREDDVAIEEARLFWSGQMLHLRRLGGKTWWSAVWQGEADSPPGWLTVVTEKAAEALKGKFDRVIYGGPDNDGKVLTQRDLKRYGLHGREGGDWPKDVKVVEYRQGTRLAFWGMEG